MSSQTPNLHLTLPVGTENVSRQIINDNNTLIDTAVGNNTSAINTLNSNKTNGKQMQWLPSNGYNPLTSETGYFCYGISPSYVPSQGIPTGYYTYGKIIGDCGGNYKWMQYIDNRGDIAIWDVEHSSWNVLSGKSIKTFSDTVQSANQYYRDTTVYDAVGKQMLAVYLDDNQWFGGLFGFDSSTGHVCVRFIDVGSGNPKALNDTTHKYTFVYGG